VPAPAGLVFPPAHVVNEGNGHKSRPQGNGHTRLLNTHFKAKQRMTCFIVERTVSRQQPLALLFPQNGVPDRTRRVEVSMEELVLRLRQELKEQRNARTR
jgi:hypothetical protein